MNINYQNLIMLLKHIDFLMKPFDINHGAYNNKGVSLTQAAICLNPHEAEFNEEMLNEMANKTLNELFAMAVNEYEQGRRLDNNLLREW